MRWQWECLVRDKKRPLFHFAQKWSSMFLRVFRCIYPKKRQPRSSTRMCGKQECPDDISFLVQVFRWTRLDDLHATGTLAMAFRGKKQKKEQICFFSWKPPSNLQKLHKILETLLSRDFLPVWMICMSLGNWQWWNRKKTVFAEEKLHQISRCRRKTSPNLWDTFVPGFSPRQRQKVDGDDNENDFTWPKVFNRITSGTKAKSVCAVLRQKTLLAKDLGQLI